MLEIYSYNLQSRRTLLFEEDVTHVDLAIIVTPYKRYTVAILCRRSEHGTLTVHCAVQ